MIHVLIVLCIVLQIVFLFGAKLISLGSDSDLDMNRQIVFTQDCHQKLKDFRKHWCVKIHMFFFWRSLVVCLSFKEGLGRFLSF